MKIIHIPDNGIIIFVRWTELTLWSRVLLENWTSQVSPLISRNPCQTNPIHNLYPYFSKIHFNNTFKSTTRSSEWLTKILYAFFIFAHLYFVMLIIFGEQCKLWSSSLYIFLHSPLTSCLLIPFLFLSILFSVCVLPETWKTKFYVHIKMSRCFIKLFRFERRSYTPAGPTWIRTKHALKMLE